MNTTNPMGTIINDIFQPIAQMANQTDKMCAEMVGAARRLVRASFYNKTGRCSVEIGNGDDQQTVHFKKVSSMVNFCNECGIDVTIDDCVIC